jgi:hypothetical protein
MVIKLNNLASTGGDRINAGNASQLKTTHKMKNLTDIANEYRAKSRRITRTERICYALLGACYTVAIVLFTFFNR